MSDRTKACMAEARAKVNATLQGCCKDLLIWKNTGLLPEGPFRRAGAEIKDVYPDDYLQLTEGIVVRAALKQVAEGC